MSSDSTASIGRRCVFFDRDGVINRSPGDGYVLSTEAFELNDGVGNLLRSIHAAGWMAIVITSQRCVGKGLIDLAGLDTIHASMQSTLMDTCGSQFDAIYAFTGLPGTENWEKPNPTMIDCACKDHGIDAEASIMIGDRDRDIEMAQRARIGKTLRLWIDDHPQTVDADQTVASIEEGRAVVQRWMDIEKRSTNEYGNHSGAVE